MQPDLAEPRINHGLTNWSAGDDVPPPPAAALRLLVPSAAAQHARPRHHPPERPAHAQQQCPSPRYRLRPATRIRQNIVTLHRTLETPSFLLLVLEFVPGEDLFYFLEQARDHYEPEQPRAATSRTRARRTVRAQRKHAQHDAHPADAQPALDAQREAAPQQRRLKLIASMFAQMYEAVAVCHDVGVYHRDIKPENFIVTDGWAEDERRVVVVKLTDFGLSTRDAESSDMDCGSAPYMSFECRNNCAPTYAPRADVWSIGIVLVNMLYHINPWTDTTQGVCSSFSA
ncbi:kinase-like domain-containing protein [Phellopilus nigrolimitatus]|nr:kinase-like domain-containing protein [Phellopilus nigrolimitatus]KAH8112013.1 kinase-like domain-containing protein [Phellopilus nigrolimitatus]